MVPSLVVVKAILIVAQYCEVETVYPWPWPLFSASSRLIWT